MMYKKISGIYEILAILGLALIFQFQCIGIKSKPDFVCDYLDQEYPGITPRPFAPHIFSVKGEYEFKLHSSLFFTPDGNEIYFINQTFPVVFGHSKSVMVMKNNNGTWSEPKTAVFSGKYGDGPVSIPEDGRRLYFGSQRPLSGSGDYKDTDIWYVDRQPDGWSEPINMGPPINTQFNEWGFSFTKNGTVYFARDSEDQNAGYDIYMSISNDGIYQTPQKLPEQINTEFSEGSPCIASDESYLIFYRTNRADRSQSGLYISFKNQDGTWSVGRNISDVWELPRGVPFSASFTPDEKYLFILNRMDGIYWVDASIIEDMKKKVFK